MEMPISRISLSSSTHFFKYLSIGGFTFPKYKATRKIHDLAFLKLPTEFPMLHRIGQKLSYLTYKQEGHLY